MSKRRRKRKSVIRVYVARTIALLILATMLILMFCGCLYIRDHLFKKEDAAQTKVDSEVKEEDKAPENSGQEIVDTVQSTKYAGFSVVIDPGHGGNDGGTSNGDIIEKEINLSISKKLEKLLKDQGTEVLLTRTDDDFLSLEERVYKSNQTTANFFISLHCNYFEDDSTITGFEAFYPRNADADIYAENIAKAAEAAGTIDVRGATENNYYVTRKTNMDAILIEMGFLSNDEECKKLASDEYQDTVAQAIAEGIFATFDAKAAESE